MGLVQTTCHEVECDSCGYRLDEDDDGVHHLSGDVAEARQQARSYGWIVTAAGTVFCLADECVEKGRRETAGDAPVLEGQADLFAAAT